MAISLRRVTDECWEATDHSSTSMTVRGLRRPDSRVQLLVSLDDPVHARPEMLRVLLSSIRTDVPHELVHQADEDQAPWVADVFREAGFYAAHTDLTVVITLDPRRLERLRRVTRAAEVDVIGAADTDLPRLRALDEAVRADIPGTDGWVWAPEDFVDETFNPDFDPATYRVAVDRPSGEYLGLLRVWMKPAGPVFGCLGVRRDRRGSRVGAVLVGDVLSTLLDRGFHTVRADVADTNRASLRVIGRFEHHVVKRAVEFVHSGG